MDSGCLFRLLQRRHFSQELGVLVPAEEEEVSGAKGYGQSGGQTNNTADLLIKKWFYYNCLLPQNDVY